jgi:hypothetical protein
VYRLPSNPSEDLGVRFFETFTVATQQSSITVVDDLKIHKPTLGLRRLVLRKRNVKLFTFKVAVYTLGDMLRLTTDSRTHWIDSRGVIFRPAKKTTFNLEFREVDKVFQKTGYSVLVLKGEIQRYRSIYGPPSPAHGVLLLVSGNLRLFYGYSLPGNTSKRRKV